ncbi:hypothetical protein F2Q70_00020563 [Brassica cretica]|uniref:Uncharacterized protein n=1 Tax=Brassica cretica TaxID=69181 RepID=A0A8S9GV59_BRACR|nr:hypothetical protein F2Q70_00020563 [Brassica cretica]
MLRSFRLDFYPINTSSYTSTLLEDSPPPPCLAARYLLYLVRAKRPHSPSHLSLNRFRPLHNRQNGS